jgi:hypothetical protein
MTTSTHKRDMASIPDESRLFTLELRAEGDGPPAVIRLRRLLKASLRNFGLRCVDVRAAGGGDGTVAADDAAACEPLGSAKCHGAQHLKKMEKSQIRSLQSSDTLPAPGRLRGTRGASNHE